MTHAHPIRHPGAPSDDARRAWLPVVLTPVVLAVGFGLGSLLLGDPNEPTAPHGWDGAWRVVLLWTVLEVAPVLGIRLSLRALRAGDPAGRAPLAVNALVFLFLVAVTLVGGLADAF